MLGFKRDDLHRETERYLANRLIQSNQYNDVVLLISQTIQPEQETSDFILHQVQRHYHYDKNYLLSQAQDTRLGKLNYQYDPIGHYLKKPMAIEGVYSKDKADIDAGASISIPLNQYPF